MIQSAVYHALRGVPKITYRAEPKSPSSSHPDHSKSVSPKPSKQEARSVVAAAAVAEAASARAPGDGADTLVVVVPGRVMQEEGIHGWRSAF